MRGRRTSYTITFQAPQDAAAITGTDLQQCPFISAIQSPKYGAINTCNSCGNGRMAPDACFARVLQIMTVPSRNCNTSSANAKPDYRKQAHYGRGPRRNFKNFETRRFSGCAYMHVYQLMSTRFAIFATTLGAVECFRK